MLSSAISYASSKEKKKSNGGQRVMGGGGCVGERKEVSGNVERGLEANQWTAVGQAKAVWEQRERLLGGVSAGGDVQSTSRSMVRCDSRSDEGRFPGADCSAARWLCCSVESNCQARRGMGRREEHAGCSDAGVQSFCQKIDTVGKWAGSRSVHNS